MSLQEIMTKALTVNGVFYDLNFEFPQVENYNKYQGFAIEDSESVVELSVKATPIEFTINDLNAIGTKRIPQREHYDVLDECIGICNDNTNCNAAAIANVADFGDKVPKILGICRLYVADYKTLLEKSNDDSVSLLQADDDIMATYVKNPCGKETGLSCGKYDISAGQQLICGANSLSIEIPRDCSSQARNPRGISHCLASALLAMLL